jgi:hypothetical protein
MKNFVRLLGAYIWLAAGAWSAATAAGEVLPAPSPGQRLPAAPTTVAGLIYYESVRTTARTSFSFGVVLEPEGVARGLFFNSSSDQSQITSGSAESGTWTYRIFDDGTAELTIATPSGFGPTAGRRTLRYATERSGEVSNLTDFSAGTFRFGDTSTRSTLVNCSSRSNIAPGQSAFTGFVVTGDQPRTVLVRAVGPGLRQFGIGDTLSDPQLSVAFRGRSIARNDDWHSTGGESIPATGSIVGAFPLTGNSRDAALVLTVGPGDYVAEASGGSGSDSGQLLLEVYLLP